MQGRGHAPLPCCFFAQCRCGGTGGIDEPFRERVRDGFGIGGSGWRPSRGLRAARASPILRPLGCCNRGPRRTGICWPRATGKARRGFSGRKTGRIFWSTRSLRSRTRKCRGIEPSADGTRAVAPDRLQLVDAGRTISMGDPTGLDLRRWRMGGGTPPEHGQPFPIPPCD